MKSFKVGNTHIGLQHKPFIIAEMSGNHNQSLERALLIVEANGQVWCSCLETADIYGGYDDT